MLGWSGGAILLKLMAAAAAADVAGHLIHMRGSEAAEGFYHIMTLLTAICKLLYLPFLSTSFRRTDTDLITMDVNT